MSRRDQSEREPKKESCPFTYKGEPCAQDTNPAGMPTETTDARNLVIYRRSPPCENIDETRVHTEPFSVPRDNEEEHDLSERGDPVKLDQPNDEDVERQYLRLSSSYGSSNISSYVELELSGASSQFRNCGACKLLMQKINCENTKQFWREMDNEGPDEQQSCHIKFYVKFLERLKDKFPEEDGLRSKNTTNLLKLLLKVDPKDPTAGVKLADLKRIIDLFGPIKLQDGKCVLINQLHQLIDRSLKSREKDKRIKSSWFVGDMTREEAENQLTSATCKDKTYLIRISGTDSDDGDFALSVRHEDHCHHIKIQGDPKRALEESPYNAHLKFAGQEFASLLKVVEYIDRNNEIKLEHDTEADDQNCESVVCLRVFTKSPLNGAMSGYEKAK